MPLRFQPPTDLLCESLSRSLATSPTTSTYFSSGSPSPDEERNVSYFGREYIHSPAPLSDLEDDDDGNDSDATLDDVDLISKIGAPLERIPPCEGRDGSIAVIAVDADHEIVHEIIYHRGVPCSSNCPSPTLSSESSMTSSITDYHAIIDEFLNNTCDPFDALNPQNFIIYDPSPSSSLYGHTPFMVKRVPRGSTELALYLDLNSDRLRNDPWNPCPHILRVVDHEPESECSYLFMERLNEYDTPSMTTVSHYLDFFRQALEGLSFLHEHDLVGFSCSDPNSFMADLSCGLRSHNSSSASLPPATTSPNESQGASTSFTSHLGRREDHFNRHDSPAARLFDRSTYPVKYYFVNFTRARLVQEHPQEQKESASPAKHQSHSHPSKRASQFKQDVKDLGLLLDRRLSDMPSVVSTKFKALVKSMTSGGFGAEDARRLFEALNRSLESEVFEWPIRPSISKRSTSLNVPLRPCRGDFGLEPDTTSLSA